MTDRPPKTEPEALFWYAKRIDELRKIDKWPRNGHEYLILFCAIHDEVFGIPGSYSITLDRSKMSKIKRTCDANKIPLEDAIRTYFEQFRDEAWHQQHGWNVTSFQPALGGVLMACKRKSAQRPSAPLPLTQDDEERMGYNSKCPAFRLARTPRQWCREGHGWEAWELIYAEPFVLLKDAALSDEHPLTGENPPWWGDGKRAGEPPEETFCDGKGNRWWFAKDGDVVLGLNEKAKCEYCAKGKTDG